MNDTKNQDADGDDDATDETTTDREPPAAPLLTTDDDESSLPLETVFDILRNERRQHVLAYLTQTDETVRIGDLAEHIAAIENDLPENALTSQQRKRVYVALYQCHLPKMGNADVIAFDKDRGTVAHGENLEQLRPYLEVGIKTADPEPQRSLPREHVPLLAGSILAYFSAALFDTGGATIGAVLLLVGFAAYGAIEYSKRAA